MMYVIYNSDGSIKSKFLNEFVMQGNNNANELFVAIEGREDYSLYASFKLPNGSTTTVVSSTPTTEFIEGLGTFTGRKILLSNAETLVAGALQMNVVCLDENDTKIVAFSTYITINETGIQLSDPILLTVQEYENLLAELKGKMNYPTKYIRVTELPLNPDLETIYILDSGNDLNEVYMYNGKTSQWILIGSNRINLGDYYTKAEGEQFEEDVNVEIGNIRNEVESIASGSPKGTYATLSDLETAYPTGTNGIYVVLADGHWYYWNSANEEWTDGGVYLSTVDAVPETRKIADIPLDHDISKNELVIETTDTQLDNKSKFPLENRSITNIVDSILNINCYKSIIGGKEKPFNLGTLYPSTNSNLYANKKGFQTSSTGAFETPRIQNHKYLIIVKIDSSLSPTYVISGLVDDGNDSTNKTYLTSVGSGWYLATKVYTSTTNNNALPLLQFLSYSNDGTDKYCYYYSIIDITDRSEFDGKTTSQIFSMFTNDQLTALCEIGTLIINSNAEAKKISYKSDNVAKFLDNFDINTIYANPSDVDYGEKTNNSYVNSSGEIKSGGGFSRTDYLDIGNNQKIKITGCVTPLGAIYDENNNFVAAITKENSSDNSTFETVEVITPDNAKYVILNFNDSYPSSSYSFQKYKRLVDIENLYLNSNALKGCLLNQWKTKTINVLGDSITKGAYTGENDSAPDSTANPKFTEIVAENLDCTVNNYGVSGTSISRTSSVNPTLAMSIRYANMSDDADLVIIIGGTNDYGTNVTLGTNADTADISFYGGLNVLCNGLATKYPTKRVIFITPFHRINEYANSVGATLKDYRDAIFEVAQDKYGFKVIDGFEILPSPINSTIWTTLFNNPNDGLHPNQEGHNLIGERLTNLLKAI